MDGLGRVLADDPEARDITIALDVSCVLAPPCTRLRTPGETKRPVRGEGFQEKPADELAVRAMAGFVHHDSSHLRAPIGVNLAGHDRERRTGCVHHIVASDLA